MIGSIKNLFAGIKGQPATGTAARTSDAQPTSPAPAAGRRAATAAAKPVHAAKAAQRALITAGGSVGGFEFSIDALVLQRLSGVDADPTERAAHLSAVLVASRLAAMSRRVGLARLPAAWMLQASPARNEAGTWIAVDFDPDDPLPDEVRQRVIRQIGYFREAGARLVWDADEDLGVAPDAWLLKPAEGQSIVERLEALRRLPTPYGSLPVIAADLENLDDIERALHGGVRFACGNMAPAAVPAAPVDAILSPDAERVAHLIGQLAAGADTALITRAIKGDVGLTIKLLQQVNGARFAHLGGVASIDQAIVLLGRDELQRWLMVVMTQYGNQRRLSSALQEVALWRARLFELLAIERGDPHPARLFTLGLATMLGVILKIDNAKVAATLSLPPASARALAGQGPWHLYVRVTEQIESQTTTDERAVAEGFASADRLLELSAEAWEWAEQTRVPVQAEPA